MKTIAIGSVALLMLGGGLFAQKGNSFLLHGNRFLSEYRGEISDSLCAEEGQHNGEVKNSKSLSKANCTLACVKLGGAEFVLYNSETERTYKLDDQQRPEAFAGQNVIVAGTYDKETETIRVANIRPVIENAF